MRALFLVLAAGLALIAYAAGTNGQPVIAIGAVAIALWLATFALPPPPPVRRGGGGAPAANSSA